MNYRYDSMDERIINSKVDYSLPVRLKWLQLTIPIVLLVLTFYLFLYQRSALQLAKFEGVAIDSPIESNANTLASANVQQKR